MRKPRVSVIIPTLAITRYLTDENLPAFSKVKEKHFEVLVLPNASSPQDKTLLANYPWLRIIPTNSVTRPALKRNIGVQKAKGEIVAFIDDDAYPSVTWLSRSIQLMEKKKVAVVCGPGILPSKSTFWEKVFDEVLKTWVGSGGLSFRFVKEKERYLDDYPSMNLLVRKELFVKVGGFGKDYWPGEDSKLCEQIVYGENEKILYSPDIYIYHHRRTALLPYLKQHGQYGFHRGAFFAHGDKNSTRPFYFVPTFFLLYLLSLPALVFVSLISLIPLSLYLLLMLFTSISGYRNTKSIRIGLASGLVLLLMHIWYGFHFIRGLVTGFVKKERIY